MKTTHPRSRVARQASLRVAVAAFAGLAMPALAYAEEVLAVTSDARLIAFDSGDPSILTLNRPLTGTAGSIVAIDVRPADGTLYGVTDTARLYRIDTATGAATAVGTGPFAPSLGSFIGIDFDPVSDVLRIVTDQNRNFRVDPDDATVVDSNGSLPSVQEDAQLAFAPTDPRFPADPTVVAIAYDNNTPSATVTTLFGIDTNLDVLVTINPENSGILSTLGSLGVNAASLAGFDVSRTSSNAFATLTLAGQVRSGLYNVNLATGGVTLAGIVGDANTLRAMTLGPAVAPPQVVTRNLIGLTTTGELVRFSSAAPGTIANRVPVTGLVQGDTLVAIDARPSNGRLYGLGNAGRIYVINASTGLATAIREQPFGVALSGTDFSFDFNTFGNRARILSNTGQNLRVHPDTGAVVDGDSATPGTQGDTQLAFAANDVNQGQTPNVAAAAYDRNDTATNTTLYVIDSNLNVLARQGSVGGTPESQNAGMLRTIGALGIDITGVAAFEIAGESTALAALITDGTTRLYSIDLTTGTATLIGNVGAAEVLTGLSAAPTSNPPAPGADLDIGKAILRFDYRRDNRDSVTIEGVLPFPASPFDGQVVTVDVGGYSDAFFLSGAGKAKNDEASRSRKDDDRFSFVGRPTDGNVRFALTIRREDLSDELTDEGLGGSQTVSKEARTVRVTITVDGTTYTSLVPLTYSAKAGKSGVAKKPKS